MDNKTPKPPLPPGKVQAFADNNGIDPALPPRPCRLSGGETPDRPEFLRVRARILNEPDVYACHALSWNAQEQRWLYLIQTPFATWPKYAVGWLDAASDEVELIAGLTLAESAKALFADMNDGDHQ